MSLAGSGIVEDVGSAKSLTRGKHTLISNNRKKRECANYTLENITYLPSKTLDMIIKGKLART